MSDLTCLFVIVLAYALYLYLALTFTAAVLSAAGPAASAVTGAGPAGGLALHKAPYNSRDYHNEHQPDEDSGEIG